ncbi:MAG: zf-HC2 domain-containing protein [Myxococcales bacterium]|nr:zf-HC2 domain-containing protein [Myxococcales bacterium]
MWGSGSRREALVLRSCEEVAVQLSDALDREVGWWERTAIRLHLLMCAPCSRMRRSLERTVGALRALGQEPGVAGEGDRED